MNYPIPTVHTLDNENMEARGMDRKQSKIDEALYLLGKEIDELSITINVLEKNLTPVLNDHPRPESGCNPDENRKPTGDSAMLESLDGLRMSVNNQTARIRMISGRLDI